MPLFLASLSPAKQREAIRHRLLRLYGLEGISCGVVQQAKAKASLCMLDIL